MDLERREGGARKNGAKKPNLPLMKGKGKGRKRLSTETKGTTAGGPSSRRKAVNDLHKYFSAAH